MNKCKLGDLLTIKHGYAFKSENYVAKSEFALVTLANISGTNNFQFIKEKTTYYGADFPKEFILTAGDLIMPLTEQVIGLFGNSAFVPHIDNITFVLNQRVGKVIPKEGKTDIYYLHYLLATKSVKDQLEYRASGTRQRNISPTDVYNVEVYVPEYKIQKKIGETLYKLEQKINNNNKINAELELMAKTIYDYWFLQFEFPNEEGKPYKSSGGNMIWNEELKREIPEGWEVTTIGDVTVCHDSKRIPLTGNEREEIKGNIPYYGATGIMGYVNRPIFDGDYVLVAEDGSVMNEKGNPIIQRVSGKIWVNNHAHVLEPIKNYSCKLLMMILKDIPVAAIKTGSIQMKINQENLNKVKILDIPNEIKKQINKQFETIDKMILENNKENQELASLRDFLLPLLMNGQVGFKE